MMRTLILDLETAPIPNVADYLDSDEPSFPTPEEVLEQVKPAKNLKDADKIKADIERRQRDALDKLEQMKTDWQIRQQKQLSEAGKDWNLNRIVCAGWWPHDAAEPTVVTCANELSERIVLLEIAERILPGDGYRAQLLGFCLRKFDVPTLLQRARYLQVHMPRISLKRWDNPHLTDLYDVLTFDDQPCTSVMRRSLPSFCRRFGITVADEHSGKDVQQLVEAGDYAAVAAHCRADLQRTRLLAERLGFLVPLVQTEVA